MKEKNWNGIIRKVLLVCLMIMLLLVFQQVHCLRGTARIINYAGTLRGVTQRFVKLEVQGTKSEQLREQIEEIFNDLQQGNISKRILKIQGIEFQDCLEDWEANWKKIRQEVRITRTFGVERSKLVSVSEENFVLSNKLVAQLEIYSESLVHMTRTIEVFILLDILGICGVFLYESTKRKHLKIFNAELTKKAYVDIHTGLANKSRCNELFASQTPIKKMTACMMFDLNDLKYVNDTLGHIAGDTLIETFAMLLKKSVPNGNFLGRYGGDEFVVVLYKTNEQEIQQILAQLQDDTKEVSFMGETMSIRFAYGYDASWYHDTCTLKELLDQADYNMYRNKKATKQSEEINARQEELIYTSI